MGKESHPHCRENKKPPYNSPGNKWGQGEALGLPVSQITGAGSETLQTSGTIYLPLAPPPSGLLNSCSRCSPSSQHYRKPREYLVQLLRTGVHADAGHGYLHMEIICEQVCTWMMICVFIQIGVKMGLELTCVCLWTAVRMCMCTRGQETMG